jgi:hypothetical protein
VQCKASCDDGGACCRDLSCGAARPTAAAVEDKIRLGGRDAGKNRGVDAIHGSLGDLCLSSVCGT